MVKRLSMFGCAFLVLVHSVKDRLPTNSYAGAHIWSIHRVCNHATRSCLSAAQMYSDQAGPHAERKHRAADVEVAAILAPLDLALISTEHRCTSAGLLLQQDRKDAGHLKSAVMLLGRLLMASLFVFVGYSQVRQHDRSRAAHGAFHCSVCVPPLHVRVR